MLNRMCNLPQAIQRNALWDIDLWAKQKPHKNAEPTQKHKTLMTYCQHFSIFSSGCKRSNLSTFSGRKGSQFF